MVGKGCSGQGDRRQTVCARGGGGVVLISRVGDVQRAGAGGCGCVGGCSRVWWAIMTGSSRGGRSTTKDCGELWGRGGARLDRSALIVVVEGVCSW